MALFSIENIAIKGIVSSIPKNKESNFSYSLFSEREATQFAQTIGVNERRICNSNVTASDLCYSAAEKLITGLSWKKDEIQILIFISQTPDYLIPNTSTILQERLGLSKQCICFDVNLGCSGYVYGLSIISSLLKNMAQAKGILLVGDTSSKIISKDDKSVYPLFSDAGSATAITFQEGNGLYFNLQSDGKGFDSIMIKDGGSRFPFSIDSIIKKNISVGIARNDMQMKLDGINIFNFALREVSQNIDSLLNYFDVKKEEIDFYILHQANRLMIETICKKGKIPVNKVPLSIMDLGNTSSASIPVTISHSIREWASIKKLKLLLSGFGVGLSWGSAILEIDKIYCPEILEVE